MKDTQNPYTANFLSALKEKYTILNDNDPSSVGILKALKYIFMIDLLVLNWIEDLPDKKGGYLQSVVFVMLVHFLRFRKKKVLWILHNKLSHYKTHLRIKRFLFRFLLRKSSVVITHANDGISFGKSFFSRREPEIHFFPHPTLPEDILPVTKIKHDILIWGAIAEYKGIDKFLEYLHTRELSTKYSILIAGKVRDPLYLQKLTALCSSTIRLEDDFIDRQTLSRYIREARVVLFTYSDDSVLSSGALVDTLVMGGNILGPANGSFKDMAEEGLIHTYRNFDDLIGQLPGIMSNPQQEGSPNLDNYLENTSWAKFISYIDNLLKT